MLNYFNEGVLLMKKINLINIFQKLTLAVAVIMFSTGCSVFKTVLRTPVKSQEIALSEEGAPFSEDDLEGNFLEEDDLEGNFLEEDDLEGDLFADEGAEDDLFADGDDLNKTEIAIADKDALDQKGDFAPDKIITPEDDVLESVSADEEILELLEDDVAVAEKIVEDKSLDKQALTFADTSSDLKNQALLKDKNQSSKDRGDFKDGLLKREVAQAKAVKPKKEISLRKRLIEPYKKNGVWLNALYIMRPNDNFSLISKKIFGNENRAEDLRAWNTHLKGKTFVGAKIYYNSPNRPTDSAQVKFFYEDIGAPSVNHVLKAGSDIRVVSEKILGHKNSWKEVWATNLHLGPTYTLSTDENFIYWKGISSEAVQTLAEVEVVKEALVAPRVSSKQQPKKVEAKNIQIPEVPSVNALVDQNLKKEISDVDGSVDNAVAVEAAAAVITNTAIAEKNDQSPPQNLKNPAVVDSNVEKPAQAAIPPVPDALGLEQEKNKKLALKDKPAIAEKQAQKEKLLAKKEKKQSSSAAVKSGVVAQIKNMLAKNQSVLGLILGLILVATILMLVVRRRSSKVASKKQGFSTADVVDEKTLNEELSGFQIEAAPAANADADSPFVPEDTVVEDGAAAGTSTDINSFAFDDSATASGLAPEDVQSDEEEDEDITSTKTLVS